MKITLHRGESATELHRKFKYVPTSTESMSKNIYLGGEYSTLFAKLD
jgi:hypothetical protein